MRAENAARIFASESVEPQKHQKRRNAEPGCSSAPLGMQTEAMLNFPKRRQ